MTRRCEYCDRPLVRKAREKPCHFAVRRYCDRACAQRHMADQRRGPGYLRKDGYRSVACYGVEILEHRLVAERKLGRPLRPEEVVHHDNENPSDNRPENLIVLPSQSAHRKLHAARRRETL